MGKIFCQVLRIKQFIQFNPFIVLGNQKWKGAAPNFINSLIFIIKIIIILLIEVKLNHLVREIIKSDLNKKLALLIDWIKKYLIILSEEKLLFLLIIKGIKLIRFTSIPIQILIIDIELIEKIVLIIIKNKNIIFVELK